MIFGAHKIHIPHEGTRRALGERLVIGVALLLLAAAASFLMLRSQASAACECNLFGEPTGQSEFNDGGSLELGVKFIPQVDGTITGVRFYKQGAMSGSHVGRLWQSNGTPMANATFTETASGWQTVTFGSPVEVTAGTTYVASVTMPDGRYIATTNFFTSDITNGPLVAPSSASAGGNGVFTGTGGSFPTATSNAANYWIDVAFYSAGEPTVSSVSPANGASGVISSENVTATFDQSMDAASFAADSFIVRDAGQNVVAGAYSYNAASRKATFNPTNELSLNTTYTVTLKGGSEPAVKNIAGIPMAGDYTWSFTTGGSSNCPCSLKDKVAPIGSTTYDDSGAVELGVKVRVAGSGYITALRFYKPLASNETTHVGNIWNTSGTKLASVVFDNETDYGWQEATLATPLEVEQGQTYIFSYGSTEAVYVASPNALSGNDIGSGFLTAHATGSAVNAATGSGNSNGVFTTSLGDYPNNGSANGTYYWVDAVFATSPDPAPLVVAATQPKANAYGIPRSQVVTATLNRTLDSATVTNDTLRLFNSNNTQVAGTSSYNTAKGEVTFTPSSPFGHGQRYTARLAGSAADNDGVTLGTEYSWSFTVGTQVTTDPSAAPGGPVLIVTNSSSPTGTYYAEMLRTEGLNYFDTKDIADINPTILNNYKVVVLAETALTQGQADVFAAWVNGGGNLVAMRPDSKLASLLGLAAVGTTRDNQYLLIDTSAGSGQGLEDDTLQFKGTADNYTLNGATALATLYSDANTATGNPAVTTRSVGSNGGTAAAFAFDLAKSVIALHQGNQSWAGQNRDGNGPVRSNDLYYGASAGDVQPDYVDLSKLHIPQADEQQRLLANIIIDSARDKQPLPRFWYLPGNHKAALVMAGDDHGVNDSGGTRAIMTKQLNNSPTDCSLLDWECVRSSHYIYTSSPLTNDQAVEFVGYGFEIGDHISTTCSNFGSFASLSAEYTADLATWRAKYTGVPNQVSHRYHCYVWSDWDSQAKVDVLNGIRYDLNYVVYPGAWIGSRAPVMTGSAMNMRFTDTTGAMLDVRQGVTNLDDQSSSLTNINALLDNATGSPAYYGIYGTHYDMSDTYDDTLMAAAQARNIPMISSQQALTWLDARNSSTFSNLSGNNGQYSFAIAAAEGAAGLRAMLPASNNGGTITSLKAGNSTVSYQTQTVKGQVYAVFDAQPGTYTATYSNYVPPGTSGGGDTGGANGGSQGAVPTPVSPSASRRVAQDPNTTVTDSQQPDEEVRTGNPDAATPLPGNGPAEVTPIAEKSNGLGLWGWALGGFGVAVAVVAVWAFIIWRRRTVSASGPL